MTLQDELKGMLSKARRYVNSAEILCQQGDYDSAMSRLYYVMFYGAEALLLSRGQTYSSHRGVISAFAKEFIKPGLLPKEMHQWFREGFDKRQISDYDFLTGISEGDVMDLKEKAENFLSSIEAFLTKEGHL